MRTTKNLLTAVLVASTGLVGCASTDDEPAPDETTRVRLYEPHTFDVDADGARLSLRTQRSIGRTVIDDTTLSLAVDEGRLAPTLDAAGNLIVDELVLALADIDVPWTVMGLDVALTDVELRLTEPTSCAATSWSSDDLIVFCDGVGLPVSLGGRFRAGKYLLPFGASYYTDLPVALVIAPSDATALWLWTNGNGKATFPYGEQTVSTALEIHMDAYSGLVR